MPKYNDLRPEADLAEKGYELVFPQMTVEEKKRTITNLLFLRARLATGVAARKADHNLLMASWNIKEFGHTDQRLPEAYFYTAEIISRFDLVAVQEVKSTMEDLHIVMRLLGEDWGYVINDITEGGDGNSERSAFVFNKKRVDFAGLAGEIVLWPDITQGSAIKQLKRTPTITGFQAGWKTFAMVNLHLQPDDGDDDVAYRAEEVRLLLEAIDHKIENAALWNENLILCGDFNLYAGANKDDPTIAAIKEKGYREVESLVGVDTNASQTEAYDRLFIADSGYFRVGKVDGVEVGGVFNPFEAVYRLGQEQTYKDEMVAVYGGNKDLDDPANLAWYYETHWRKNQMSDHFPIWFELITDSSDEFLEDKLASY